MKQVSRTILFFAFCIFSTQACTQGSSASSPPNPRSTKVLRAIPIEKGEEKETVLRAIPVEDEENNEAVLRAIPVEDAEIAPRATRVEEEKIAPRTPLVPNDGFQDIANAMIGKPSDKRERARGVYQEWLTGRRGLYSPEYRKLYANFAETSLTRARHETRTLYYPFGGPDVIYPLIFFPRITTLILVGTESIGTLPTLEVAQSARYQESISSMMSIYLGSTLYRTKDMKSEASEALNSATWAKMMAAIALLDLKIVSTETGTLSAQGTWQANSITPKAERNPKSPQGVVFYCKRGQGNRSEMVSIYYFQQNLGQSNFDSLISLPQAKPFQNFIARFKGSYTSFLKAASYLSHDTEGFKTSNEIIFSGNKIVQAPSGVPFSEFVKRRGSWNLSLFGDYRPPSESFSDHHQENLKQAFREAITQDGNGDYSDFVNYGGKLPFHYDYGTGADGSGKGSMLFYAIRTKR